MLKLRKVRRPLAWKTLLGRVAATFALSLVHTGCSDSAATTQRSVTASQSFPISLASSADFGFIVSGGSEQIRIVKLRNNSGDAVQISSWTTSCECLSIRPRNLSLAPRESVFVILRYDTEKEPDFVGDLLVSVEAYAGSQRVSVWNVPVSVISSASLSHVEDPKVLEELSM